MTYWRTVFCCFNALYICILLYLLCCLKYLPFNRGSSVNFALQNQILPKLNQLKELSSAVFTEHLKHWNGKLKFGPSICFLSYINSLGLLIT